MTYVIHTDAPFEVVEKSWADKVRVIEGVTPHGTPDCFYGWAEPQSSPACRDHTILYGDMDQVLLQAAYILLDTGHQVVVMLPSSGSGDMVEAPEAPLRYDDDHQH